jgi:hypothetical protein
MFSSLSEGAFTGFPRLAKNSERFLSEHVGSFFTP